MRQIRRPNISDVTLVLITSVYLLFLTNFTFWSKASTYFAGHPWEEISMGIGLLALFIATGLSIAVKYLTKPVLIFFILIAAGASYFTDNAGVIISHQMIENMVTTTSAEAKHLITAEFCAYFALFGLLPSLLVGWVRIHHLTFGRKLVQHLKIIVPCLLVAIGSVALNYPAFASVFREHQDMMDTLNPPAPVISAVKYVKLALMERDIKAKPIGTDAHVIATGNARPIVTVIVVGETARAQNFAFYGYERDTNPETRKRGVIAFGGTTSCGTSTAVSLPCMFSIYGRDEYSSYKAKATENLLDVLGYAGIRTEWWDDNTGSKGIADRTRYANFSQGDDPHFCFEGECRDDILVEKLRKELRSVKGNTVFVLHQIGSHGPAYYMRYVEETAPFKPDCRTASFDNCTQEQLVNSYDDTIAYTDKILADVIDALKAESATMASAMIYMSDHGESLGESGLYLHGAPYMFAPESQTHVPFLAWFSENYASATGLDTSCVRSRREGPYSHDNLFHTVLGMMRVETGIYAKKLDVLAPCRNTVHS